MLETGETLEKAEKIEPTTNIVAEHLAIQLALEMAIDAGVRQLVVWNDSRSPVNHVLGTYKIKQDHLRPLVDQTRQLVSRLESFSIEWVPREKTVRADRLCREVDKRPGAR